MQILSSQHLAELLIGIARAQAAVVQAMEKETAGFHSGRAIAALEDVNQPAPALSGLPVRILLSTLRRTGPDEAAIAKELERLCAGQAVGGSPGADLDFGAPPA